jgi:hypothetical protein
VREVPADAIFCDDGGSTGLGSRRMRVVTISATYGAGGGLVGPAVADRLGVPFVDRAIPVAVADNLGISVDDALSRDE